MDIKQRLKDLMDERGLNMYTLAKRSNVSWNTIKNFYARDSKPTLTTIELLCDGLGITLAQFFDEGGNSVSLTAEQQYVLDRWSRISDEEKQIISGMLDVMVSKRG